ncbi:superoxide dismutase, Cu-Zn family [Noviherbaspirillum humi]|uniref:Superoxide dismutase [Cu-Zn] n=1 Tax=Noviherbaspirillum humi TaxID=1688639 RepID=A0A239DI94_9BURK|nr:superoxide dismutase family protein [Noviherbaspirillum humi]SNS31608.1 superoxide dismutase, Cu-Zn family [Noviherbaspirillum humi]
MKTIYAMLGMLALAACQSSPMQAAGAGKGARATLEPRSASSAAGDVSFAERGDRLLVTVKASGLKPNSAHGFHVHEKGDCSAADATSAGGHFNPDGQQHNHPNQPSRHAGDLPNLMSDAQGNANVSFEVGMLTLDSGKYGILDRAVVIHANPDDYASQPAGNSGGRIACGIIKKS